MFITKFQFIPNNQMTKYSNIIIPVSGVSLCAMHIKTHLCCVHVQACVFIHNHVLWRAAVISLEECKLQNKHAEHTCVCCVCVYMAECSAVRACASVRPLVCSIME